GCIAPLAHQMTTIPMGVVQLAFASAIVRTRLRDVEVIIKRGVAYTEFLSAATVLYIDMLRTTGFFFSNDSDQHNWIVALLATLVVILVARPVRESVQNALDRVFYRDR